MCIYMYICIYIICTYITYVLYIVSYNILKERERMHVDE